MDHFQILIILQEPDDEPLESKYVAVLKNERYFASKPNCVRLYSNFF